MAAAEVPAQEGLLSTEEHDGDAAMLQESVDIAGHATAGSDAKSAMEAKENPKKAKVSAKRASSKAKAAPKKTIAKVARAEGEETSRKRDGDDGEARDIAPSAKAPAKKTGAKARKESKADGMEKVASSTMMLDKDEESADESQAAKKTHAKKVLAKTEEIDAKALEDEQEATKGNEFARVLSRSSRKGSKRQAPTFGAFAELPEAKKHRSMKAPYRFKTTVPSAGLRRLNKDACDCFVQIKVPNGTANFVFRNFSNEEEVAALKAELLGRCSLDDELDRQKLQVECARHAVARAMDSGLFSLDDGGVCRINAREGAVLEVHTDQWWLAKGRQLVYDPARYFLRSPVSKKKSFGLLDGVVAALKAALNKSRGAAEEHFEAALAVALACLSSRFAELCAHMTNLGLVFRGEQGIFAKLLGPEYDAVSMALILEEWRHDGPEYLRALLDRPFGAGIAAFSGRFYCAGASCGFLTPDLSQARRFLETSDASVPPATVVSQRLGPVRQLLLVHSDDERARPILSYATANGLYALSLRFESLDSAMRAGAGIAQWLSAGDADAGRAALAGMLDQNAEALLPSAEVLLVFLQACAAMTGRVMANLRAANYVHFASTTYDIEALAPWARAE